MLVINRKLFIGNFSLPILKIQKDTVMSMMRSGHNPDMIKFEVQENSQHPNYGVRFQVHEIVMDQWFDDGTLTVWGN